MARILRPASVASLILIISFSPVAMALQPDPRPLREYRIKAAFLYNFAKFVEWPSQAFEDNDSTLILGVFGDDPFGAALQSLSGKTVRGRRLTIKRFDSLLDLDQCHILFITASAQQQQQEALESLEGSNVLTVGEMQRFAQMGGIINFVIRKNKLRFEINLGAGKRAGLMISSQLLNLADSVVQ